MISVNGNNIYLTRGDTLKCHIAMYDTEGNEYTPESTDSIRFALKRTVNDRRPLILKEIPYDTLLLSIYPDDTKELEFGNYIYDIELTTASGTVDTFIADAKFVLTTEVH